MTRPEYTSVEQAVMQLMAHGITREEIRDKTGMSLSTVARIARDATDKAVYPGAAIIQGIATMVAEGAISVPFKGQRATARETALFWLETRLMSCVSLPEFIELRDAVKATREADK